MRGYILAACLAMASMPAMADWNVQTLPGGDCMAVADYDNGVRVGLYSSKQRDDVGIAIIDAKVDRRAIYSLSVRPGVGDPIMLIGSAETGVIIADRIKPDEFLRIVRSNSVSIQGFGVFNFSKASAAVEKVLECTMKP